MEDVDSWEPNVRAVRSRVGESLLGCSVITLEKNVCRLAGSGPISKFRESIERCREADKLSLIHI